MRTVALPLLSLLLSGICIAQTTTTTYQASTGTVSPGNAVTGNFVAVQSSNQTTYVTFPSGYSYPSMTVSDPTLNLVPNAYAGSVIVVEGHLVTIASNDATSVTIKFWFYGAPPADGTPFEINQGKFNSPNGMGGGCYYGQCPNWQFSGYPLSYTLPDGTTASFNNFAGSANFTNPADIHVSGTANGYDSTGAAVTVSVSWDFKASCRSGRGGGCYKTFLDGTLKVTK